MITSKPISTLPHNLAQGGLLYMADIILQPVAASGCKQPLTGLNVLQLMLRKNVLLLLENLNWEPVLAEVNYMPVTPAETMHFLTQINSPALRWSFTANHAHFLPDAGGIEGFIDAVDFSYCHEVRLADNNGSYEIHQRPGEGTINFGALFKKIESMGYTGHYTNGFTTLDDMVAGRDYMVERAREAGLKVD